jgi:hypothetical protein
MKKFLAVLTIVLFVAMTGVVQAADFVNGGFETGDFTGWTQGGGYWYGGAAPINPATYDGGPPNNYIMSGGTDPYTGAPTVYNGKYSVRANDNYNNYSVSTIKQSVTNYTQNNIYFAWNAVLEGSHGLYDSDYFSLTLRDDSKGIDVVSRAYSSAGAIGAGTSGVTWTLYSGYVYSSDWVTEQIDLVKLGLVGDDFTLTLLASDCPYGGHWGYAYLDGFGGTPPVQSTPEPATLLLLGFGLAGLATLRKKI